MHTIKWTIAVTILLVSSALFAANANDVVVSHYEPLQRLSIRSAGNSIDSSSQKIQRSAPIELSFDAMGRVFDLRLEPNDRLLSAAPAGMQLAGIGVYRGRLEGVQGSWARITVVDGVPRGLIWDGDEMFALEAPGDSLLQISSPVIYRLADMIIVPGTMRCGEASLSGSGAGIYNKLVMEIGGAAAQAPGAITEITMGAIGDSGFTSSKGGDAGAVTAIMNRLNLVDGYFSEQVGVQINVQTIETFDAASDPFSSTGDAGTLLDELTTYRSNTPTQNTLGLTHLYTGRDLDTTTVGIAWRGTLCSTSFGAGLSEGNGSPTLDSLIAAHEIGHNFNAEHDGQPGTSCESETGLFVMSPSVNGNDQFSACSIAVMQAEAAAANCVTALPAVDVSVKLSNASTTLLLGANTDLVYDVTSNGLLDATSVVADFALPNNLTLGTVTPSAGSCTTGTGTVSCTLGDVPGMTSRTVTIAATPDSVGAGLLTATVVTADVDERPVNNLESLLLTVNPAVDLVINAPPAASILVNATTTVSAQLENTSTLDASGITLSISLSNGLLAESASWSLGTCTVAPQQIDCVAATFAAQSSSTLSVGVRGVTTGSKTLTVTLSSVEAEANPADNSISASVRVSDPEKKDEGGGSTGPMFLLLLVLTTVLARRQPVTGRS